MARFAWWKDASPEARTALVAASFGWMLDAFDVMLYAMVLAALMADLGLAKGTAGLLSSLTLAASAVGGLVFGVVADRFGRRKALMASILIYSVFTAACGLATGVVMLAVFRICLGLGMGGEWASGAALVSETWPAAHRGKALGIVQSSWAVGYAAAAAVAALVLPVWGWRGVFFVGVIPAFFTLWIQRRVEEPEIWRASRSSAPPVRTGFGEIFGRRRLRLTLLITLMNACTMFGWWGFNLWLPAYLSMPADQGGMGFSPRTMSGLVIFMQAGMWLGYISFGFISDRFGRKRSYIGFLGAAAAFLLLYARARSPFVLLLLGPFVAFFGTGYFTGFGALTAEIYPTAVRATAQGITYNTGRIVSAAAPFVVGSLAQSKGFGFSFSLIAAAFLAAALLWAGIPETKGRALA
ncbi:MAG: MFS transporter [Candidatus Aminicenantes bacterium]|jgi:MFS family permease|nr:MFS transporter [Candidatus Aminicenantes bacterium]NLH75478.1 MFS transporter [Acidobacteriota bacterium]